MRLPLRHLFLAFALCSAVLELAAQGGVVLHGKVKEFGRKKGMGGVEVTLREDTVVIAKQLTAHTGWYSFATICGRKLSLHFAYPGRLPKYVVLDGREAREGCNCDLMIDTQLCPIVEGKEASFTAEPFAEATYFPASGLFVWDMDRSQRMRAAQEAYRTR